MPAEAEADNDIDIDAISNFIIYLILLCYVVATGPSWAEAGKIMWVLFLIGYSTDFTRFFICCPSWQISQLGNQGGY